MTQGGQPPRQPAPPAAPVAEANVILLKGNIVKKYISLIILTLGISFSMMSEANENKATSADLRNMVFNLKPSEIGLSKESFGHPVWGMVMETGFSDGSFTLVALADGTTSLYFSNGGGIIGGGEHESVRSASGHYLTGAQHYYQKAQKVTEYPVPSDGEVKFYFLTYEGTLMYSASEEKLGNEKDELSNLFFAAHGVISELRKIEQK
jgi:hypothetical protein